MNAKIFKNYILIHLEKQCRCQDESCPFRTRDEDIVGKLDLMLPTNVNNTSVHLATLLSGYFSPILNEVINDIKCTICSKPTVMTRFLLPDLPKIIVLYIDVMTLNGKSDLDVWVPDTLSFYGYVKRQNGQNNLPDKTQYIWGIILAIISFSLVVFPSGIAIQLI